ncbi:MAG: hypothetical protein HKN92_07560 [Chitinophagales bacterium]|nr:hypothetical protein [Chitinophagales bacterium]
MLQEQVVKLASISGFQLLETHISWVLLGKEHVFKIKKPIKYPFLDFSTLKDRKKYCQNEVKLNSRLSNIYLDVLPITNEKGEIYVDGRGKTIDYAVRMKRMQTGKRMDIMLTKNKVEMSQMLNLAEKIAEFHLKATIVRPVFSKRILKNTFNEIRSVRDWIKENLSSKYASDLDRMIIYSDRFIDKHSGLIKKRIKEGYYRDVHGDLHSRNIFLYRDPVIFDCIEFNDSFRQIDVLNEVAFFCMDLEAHGRNDLSNGFMNHYLELSPCMNTDEERLLFNYYKCFRANVRAKVNTLRAMQTVDPTEIEVYSREIRDYIRMMVSLND